ncbi:MAG: hemerythrin domain-containing protein [Acidimicrobiia bacterium]
MSTLAEPIVDLYRDIHKGIRSELFAVTSFAGSLDPADRADRVALCAHVVSVAAVLESHAKHEDTVIEPVLLACRPELACSIGKDHVRFEESFTGIARSVAAFVDANDVDQREIARTIYLDLAGFTGTYLEHQDVEERVVMPAIAQAIGPDQVLGLHMQIVSSIPADEMARSLAFMLPAMNVDDRAELLAGMRAGAPAEAFAGVVGLARSVLRPGEFDALAGRLGVA